MTLQPDWAERFDKEFGKTFGIVSHDTVTLGAEHMLKEFIKNEIDIAYSRGIEDAAKVAENTPSSGRIAVDTDGTLGIIGGKQIAQAIRRLWKQKP